MNIQDSINTAKAIVSEYEGFTLSVSEGDTDMYTLFLSGKGSIYALRPSTCVHLMRHDSQYRVVVISLNITTTLDQLPSLVRNICNTLVLDNKEKVYDN